MVCFTLQMVLERFDIAGKIQLDPPRWQNIVVQLQFLCDGTGTTSLVLRHCDVTGYLVPQILKRARYSGYPRTRQFSFNSVQCQYGRHAEKKKKEINIYPTPMVPYILVVALNILFLCLDKSEFWMVFSIMKRTTVAKYCSTTSFSLWCHWYYVTGLCDVTGYLVPQILKRAWYSGYPPEKPPAKQYFQYCSQRVSFRSEKKKKKSISTLRQWSRIY